jgi:hypothetical protein
MCIKNIIFFCGILCSTRLLAADVNFQGTLIEPPPCIINNGNDIDVNFGDSIGINSINGINHLKQIDYRINCELGAALDHLVLVISGEPSAFDNSAVDSSLPGLSIKLLVDNNPVEFGQSINVDTSHIPVLQAVLIKSSEVILSEGPFNAAATLQVMYQ